MDYRRLKGGKTDIPLSWSDLKRAARNEVPVYVETREPLHRPEGWTVFPVLSGPLIKLGRFSIQKPRSVSRFEFVVALEVDGKLISVFQALLHTKVVFRTIISDFSELTHIKGTQTGDIVALLVEEPVDPMGERCLALSHRGGTGLHDGSWGSADVWKIFERSVESSRDDENGMLDVLCEMLRGRTFEPVRRYSPAHKKIRKKRAPWIWKEWEDQHKND